MSELLVQDTSLAAIANVIREKAKTTDALEFPNDFISAISALGGVSDGVDVASGTYTPTQTIDSIVSIEHGMNVRPNFMFILPESVDVESGSYTSTEIKWEIIFDQNIIYSDGSNNGGVVIAVQHNNYSGRSGSKTTPETKGGADTTHCYFLSETNIRFKVGTTYRWIAARITRT